MGEDWRTRARKRVGDRVAADMAKYLAEPALSPEEFEAAMRDSQFGDDEQDLLRLADRIEAVLRTVPIRLGHNALACLERGETVVLSAGEYRDMALAVALELAGKDER